MKSWIHRVLIFLSLISLMACGGGVTTHDTVVGDPGVRGDGSVQKGPFITGSAIVAQGLNSSLDPNGKTYQLITEDDFGTYRFNAEMGEGVFQFIAQGFYFNEISGELSSAPLSLRATVNLAQSPRANINMLTSLTERRIVSLVRNEGMDFASAKVKAEEEILKLFNIATLQTPGFEVLDISQAGNENAILLGISAALQGDLTVAQLSERLAKLSFDMEDGVLDDQTKLDELIASEEGLNLEAIRANIEARYQQLGFTTVEIPPFELHAQRLVPLEVKELKMMPGWSDFSEIKQVDGTLSYNIKTYSSCPPVPDNSVPVPQEAVDPAISTFTVTLRKRLGANSVNGTTIQLKSGNENVPLLFDYQVGSLTLGIRLQGPMNPQKIYTLTIDGLVAFDGTPQVAPFSQQIQQPLIIAKPFVNFDIMASEFRFTFPDIPLTNPKAEDFSLSDGNSQVPLELLYDATNDQYRLIAKQTLIENTLYTLQIKSLKAFQASIDIPHYSWDIQIPKADLTTNLQAYYKLDGNADNSSSNLFHGSINELVELTQDRFGQANKAMKIYIDSPNPPHPEIKLPKSVFNHQEAWTYSFWLKSDGGLTESLFSLIAMDDSLAPIFQMEWYILEGGICSTNYIAGDPNNSNAYLMGMSSALKYPGWNHLVLIHHGNLSFSLYVNGKAAVLNKATPWKPIFYNNTKSYVIGGDASFPDLFVNSSFDDLHFYQRALDPYEVKKLYEIEKVPQ